MLVLAAFGANAADEVLRNPVLRSVASGWTDLGRAEIPFGTLHATNVNTASLSVTGTLSTATVAAGTVSANSVSVTGNLTASNMIYSAWRWTDMVTSLFILTAGATAPVQVNIGNGVLALGYDTGIGTAADASFSLQSPHKFAQTNAANPVFWIGPHGHISATTLAAGTNATWVLYLYAAPVNGQYKDAFYIRTNTYGFTRTNGNDIISFGNITNNAWAGKSSVMFRGRMVRIASASNDVGSGAVCTLDSFDIHYPFDQQGSHAQSGD